MNFTSFNANNPAIKDSNVDKTNPRLSYWLDSFSRKNNSNHFTNINEG